jgi:hypothetical protein
MKRHSKNTILHYTSALAPKRQGVDRKGLAVAVIFLAAVSLWGVWRGAGTTQPVIEWHEQPNLSAQIEIHSGIKGALEEGTVQPVESLAGFAPALHDPRQGR